MAEDKVNEAAWNITDSVRKSNQAVVTSSIAAQERNIRFAQSVSVSETDLLKSHVESTRNLMEAVAESAQKPQDISQVALDSFVAAQERNIQFIQSTFENSIVVLQSHAEATRALTQELTEQVKVQSKAFQAIAQAYVDMYTSFFYAPFSYYKQALETTESISRQGFESLEKIAR